MIKKANLAHNFLGRLAPRAINQEGHEVSNEMLGHGHASKTRMTEDLKAVLRSGIYAGGGFLATSVVAPMLGWGAGGDEKEKSAAFLLKKAVEQAAGNQSSPSSGSRLLKSVGVGTLGGAAAGSGAAGIYAAVQALRGKPVGNLLKPLLIGGASTGALLGGIAGTGAGTYGIMKEKQHGR